MGTGQAGAVLFPSVDRALFAATFVERLRGSGLRPALVATEHFAQALAIADPRTSDELYWVARVCLVDDVAQLEVFDRVFAAVFQAARPGVDPASRRTPLVPPPAAPDDVHVGIPRQDAREAGGGSVPWVTAPNAATDEDAGPASESVVPELRPSARERLAEVPFDQLDEADLLRVGAAIETAARRWPTRRARRLRRDPSGRTVDRRRTLRAALRTGGEPVALARAERIHRPRSVVMLADVSGSMQTYARAYLHLLRGLGRIVDAETFAFATRLTRLTPVLRNRDPRTAVERATEQVTDRFSGTRIAHSIRTLLRHPTWSTSVRGAVVVIASDGWDSDPPEELAARMQRLARMSERVVWVNPRVAAPGFEPTTAGMAAALPHCDRLVSGHSLAAMEELFDAMVVRGTPGAGHA